MRRALFLALISTTTALVATDSRVTKGSPRFQKFSTFILDTQEKILSQLEDADGSGATFARDPWERDDGSFGLTTCIEDGALIEKGACSVSIIHGKLTADRAKAMSGRRNTPYEAGQAYSAAAISLVFHSRSPLVPTFRADVRFFEISGDGGWFGGGADLTPYYLVDSDCTAFHRHYKAICDEYSVPMGYGSQARLYEDLKARCDEYFQLPARGECRGVGGIFFDDLTGIAEDGAGEGAGFTGAWTEESLDLAQGFTEAVANGWMDSWLPICERQRKLPYTDEQREWQLIRRGRYLEFNLLYDRGVRFGLVPGGRTEAVMVSAPPLIRWKYNHVPEPGSEEERLVGVLREPRSWA